jgi:hypothetical protein
MTSTEKDTEDTSRGKRRDRPQRFEGEVKVDAGEDPEGGGAADLKGYEQSVHCGSGMVNVIP